MGRIEDLKLFVHIVESGSISKAADKLSIAKSAVSRRLSLLETRYDTRLIDRTPGVWEVTETGHELYQRATRVVGDVAEIEDDFVNISSDITGPLYVSVPRDFGIAFLNDMLIAFKQRYSKIQLSVDFDDRTVDLARENYDFAVRITPELESNVSGEKIGTVQHGLFASPEYIKAHSNPHSFEELRKHPLLNFRTARRAVWNFETDKSKPQSFEFQPFLNSNSGVFLLEATLNGLGIARLPDFVSSKAQTAGHLVPVLSGINIPEVGIYLAHAQNRRLNRRMRLFAEEIKKACLS